MLLCGLWFGRGSPKMSISLRPFILELQDLAKHGVKRIIDGETEITCPFFALACTVDAVANPKLQAIKQFNCHFGCGYCLHPNIPLADTNRQGCYIADQIYTLRTHEKAVEDMFTAKILKEMGDLKRLKATSTRMETWDDINGFKGVSCLLNIPYFDSVFGYTADYKVRSKINETFSK